MKTKIAEFIEEFNKINVKGLIIDIRGNSGGDDNEVWELCGYFFKYKTLIERVAVTTQMGKALSKANG